MQRLIEQLEAVRRRARLTLVAIRVATWLSAVVGAALVLGLADYVLRLPGWLRLVVGLAVAAVAVGWAVVRIGRAIRVDVALTTVAQRLERLYPAAAGKLASGVAFSTQAETVPAGGGGGGTASESAERQFREQARRDAEGVLNDEEIDRLLDTSRAWRQAAILAVVLLLTAGVAVAAPESTSIAAQRWLKPLGDAAWPNRYAVESRTDRAVAPNDVPLRLSAAVTKGDRDGLRTWVAYQFLDGADDAPRAGAWQRALMTRQESAADAAGGGEYERLVELAGDAGAIAFYFEAGDDESDVEVVELVEPPTLREVVATVQPPAYAEDFVSPQQQYLLNPPRPTVTVEALAGSRVELELRVRGSFDPPNSEAERRRVIEWVRQTLAGLIDEDTDIDAMDLTYRVISRNEGDMRLGVGWNLRETGQFQFMLADAYGSRYEDQRLFRFEARPDRQPSASILVPGSDEQVLPTATVAVAAEGHDDVAVADLNLHATAERATEAEDAAAEPVLLASSGAVQPRATAEGELDLSTMDLAEGDQVALVAVVRDNFELDGERHEAVESAVRWLRIISEEEMRRQLQTELADVRQRAIRARDAQRQLREAEIDRRTAGQQQEMGERLEAMDRTIDSLRERVERNQLDAESIEQTLEQSQQLVEGAQERSDEAADRLARAAEGADDPQQAEQREQEARQAQDAAQEELDRLVQLLDQGRDAYEIQERLTRLQREQEALHDDVRELLPRTLGQQLEDLADAERQALEEAAEGQQNLAEDAAELMERMRSTAAALNRNAERPEEQAVAEALRQAADTADEQALEEQMEQAAEEAGENRLSQAQQQQEAAREVLRQMQEQMGRMDQLRQEILTRQLLELVESIEELRDQQQAQIDRLREAVNVAQLDDGMMRLRRNTMAVAEDARQAGDGALEVAALLEQAAEHMAEAIRTLREAEADRDAAENAERNSLTKLNEALEIARQLSEEAEEEQAQQERQELVRAYQASLEEQAAVREQTRELADVAEDDRTRRWRADARERGEAQQAIREQLQELEEKIAETIVYRSMHEQMDGWASAAADALREGSAGDRTVFDQDMIVTALEGLIASLEEVDEPNDEFAENQGEEGGGGGGQGGGEGELIPSIAELRLLRSRQVLIRDLTRNFDEGAAAMDEALVDELSRQQESLAVTGEQLIEQLQQEMQQGGQQPMPQPQEPEADGEGDGADDGGADEQPQPEGGELDEALDLLPELQRELEEQQP